MENTDMPRPPSEWLAHILLYTNQSTAANNKVLCIHVVSQLGYLAKNLIIMLVTKHHFTHSS